MFDADGFDITKDQFNKSEVIKAFAASNNDTGSCEVQIALLTARIRMLTLHLRTHKKDFHSRRGMLKLISNRDGLLKYLFSNDKARYEKIIAACNIRKRFGK